MKPIDEEQNKFYDEFYQLCPHCGYINIISKELLSAGVRERIEKRCQDDKLLFKKMCLYSELCGLEKISLTKGKRLVK